MKIGNKGKIIGVSMMGVLLLVIMGSVSYQVTNSYPVPDPFYKPPVYRKTLESEGYLNEHGEDGDWVPKDLVCLNQLVLRPEIPGVVKQASTQYTIGSLDISAKASVSADKEVKVGVDAVASSETNYGLDIEVEGGCLTETTNKETATISISSSSSYELGFSATIYEIKITQAYKKYRVDKYEIQSDGTEEYVGFSHYELDVATEIVGVRNIEYVGIGYDHDSATHRSLYSFISDIYQEILDGDYTYDTKSKVWGDLLVSFEDEREDKTTWYGSVTVEVTAGWGSELGFGAATTSTSIEVSFGTTVKGSNTNGEIEIATFESGFYGSGDVYNVNINYLDIGAFWIRGSLYNPPPPTFPTFPRI